MTSPLGVGGQPTEILEFQSRGQHPSGRRDRFCDGFERDLDPPVRDGRLPADQLVG